MKSLKTNIFFKISMIFLIGLVLLIPANMIRGLIREREYNQKTTIKEVGSKWGKEQTISGPYVTIPYYRSVKQTTQGDTTARTTRVKEYMHFLPTALNINGTIFPERRYRGIYEIVVYNSKLNISGMFDNIKFANSDIPKEDILFNEAFISIGISDLRGIQKQIYLDWNNNKSLFNPGTVTNDNIESGINAPIEIVNNDSLDYNFSFDLVLKGSQLLYFTPVGKVTDVNISSSWNNPSFNGAFLPDSRSITKSGFKANWNVLHLNRNFPQKWVGGSYNTSSSVFGIDLLLPVDNYQKSTRSIKYAVLFIFFTFLVFFFVEILNKVFIHPVQYLLVGLALIVFYTLLLSISEHLNFNLAFLFSALATLLLISGYVKAILKSNKLTGFIGGILLILYGFIFIIIQLQDLALLIGSIGIFLVLCLVMYFSRKIDWYNLKMDDK